MGSNTTEVIHEAHSNHSKTLPEGKFVPWRLRRVPGFLPIRMQDFLHGRKSNLQTKELKGSKRSQGCGFAGGHVCPPALFGWASMRKGRFAVRTQNKRIGAVKWFIYLKPAG
jgi:hypothetical protein